MADFPADEFRARHERAKELMEEHGIDALLLTEEENLTYFSGFRPLSSGHSKDRGHMYHLLLLPKVGSPVLVLPLVMRGNAEAMSWVDDVRFFLADWTFAPFLSVPSSDPIDHVTKAVEDLSLDDKAIGIEYSSNTRMDLSQKDFQAIKKSLPNANLVDAGELIWNLRSVKSFLEIQHLRTACEISCGAFRVMLESLREGMTEKEILRAFYGGVIDGGGEDNPLKAWLSIRAGKEKYALAYTRSSDYRVRKGDIVLMDGGANYKGYCADMCRVACIGEPSGKQEKLFDCAVKSQEAALSMVRSGASVQDVAISAVNTARELGCERNLPYISHGHGIGLSVHEPPYLHINSKSKLQAGMVVTVEPTFYDATALNYIISGAGEKGSDGVFFVEDDIVVTKSGYENLTPMSKELWIAR